MHEIVEKQDRPLLGNDVFGRLRRVNQTSENGEVANDLNESPDTHPDGVVSDMDSASETSEGSSDGGTDEGEIALSEWVKRPRRSRRLNNQEPVVVFADAETNRGSEECSLLHMATNDMDGRIDRDACVKKHVPKKRNIESVHAIETRRDTNESKDLEGHIT